MQKTLLIVALVLIALGVVGAGVVYAQGQVPPTYGNMMGWGGGGRMHDYVEQALAAKLGLTEQQVEEKLASGQTMYQIAQGAGIKDADIPALLTEVHKTAFDKAVADGVLTQQQADWMLQRMQGNWGANGGPGNCPMHNGTYGPNGGYGPNNGSGYRGGMMRGWQTQSQ